MTTRPRFDLTCRPDCPACIMIRTAWSPQGPQITSKPHYNIDGHKVLQMYALTTAVLKRMSDALILRIVNEAGQDEAEVRKKFDWMVEEETKRHAGDNIVG